MIILNCKIKSNEIVYEVKTNKNNYFTYSLPKDITSYKVRKVLKIIESKVDEDEDYLSKGGWGMEDPRYCPFFKLTNKEKPYIMQVWNSCSVKRLKKPLMLAWGVFSL